MAGWLDGWLARWMDDWMDGWLAGWIVGWVDGWMIRWEVFWLCVLKHLACGSWCKFRLSWLHYQASDDDQAAFEACQQLSVFSLVTTFAWSSSLERSTKRKREFISICQRFNRPNGWERCNSIALCLFSYATVRDRIVSFFLCFFPLTFLLLFLLLSFFIPSFIPSSPTVNSSGSAAYWRHEQTTACVSNQPVNVQLIEILLIRVEYVLFWPSRLRLSVQVRVQSQYSVQSGVSSLGFHSLQPRAWPLTLTEYVRPGSWLWLTRLSYLVLVSHFCLMAFVLQ